MDKSVFNTVNDFVGDVAHTLIGTISPEDFYNNSNEIYARLMQFRQANNINPKKVWTKQEIEQLKKNKKIKDFELLNRYDSDFLLFLFNEVAQNNQQNKDDLQYARQGIKLIPRKRYIK